MQKLMVFIDGNNLFRGEIKINYPKLIKFLSEQFEDHHLVRVYYYIGIPTKAVWDKNYESWENFSKKLDKQIKFLDSLQFNHNFHVITRPLVLIDGKRREKGIDVHIACDVVWHGLSNNYDSCIIISGDKDLLEAIHRMKDCGKKVIVANFEKSISRDIIKLSDKYINLTKHKDKIEFKS